LEAEGKGMRGEGRRSEGKEGQGEKGKKKEIPLIPPPTKNFLHQCIELHMTCKQRHLH